MPIHVSQAPSHVQVAHAAKAPVKTGAVRAVSIKRPPARPTGARIAGASKIVSNIPVLSTVGGIVQGGSQLITGKTLTEHLTGYVTGGGTPVSMSALTGGGAAGGGSTVLSVGRKYILRQTATGRIVATPRTPRRRFSHRARGSKMEKLLEYALIAHMFK